MSTNIINYNQRAKTSTVVSTIAIAIVFGLVGAFLGLLVGIPLILGVLFALVGAVGFIYITSVTPRTVMRQIKAKQLAPYAEPRLRNLVDGLCMSVGVETPELMIIPTNSMNCATIGRTPADSKLVVTRGLLESLGRIELEAVIARALAQIKSGETELGTQLLGPLRLAVTPAVGNLIWARLLTERFDVMADLDGVSHTRYPPALASALDKIKTMGEVPGVPAYMAHLWLLSPLARPIEGAPHSRLEERIDLLQEL